MTAITPLGNQNISKQDSAQIKQMLKTALEKPFKSNLYTAQISRETPAAFLIMLDQSGSMGEMLNFNGNEITKAEAVADILNKLLGELINRCKKADGIRDYFDIAIIGYGGESAYKANLVWKNELAGKDWIKVGELNDNFLEEKEIEIEKNIRGVVKSTKTTIKKWVDPLCKYKTPMKDALELARNLIESWIVSHSSQIHFPPIVINITDGLATDANEAELLEASEALKQIHTPDGHLLFINIHLTNSKSDSVIFPSNRKLLPDNAFAHLLYNMSSLMPPLFNIEIAELLKTDATDKYVGMAFNADIKELIQILNIGTSTSKGL